MIRLAMDFRQRFFDLLIPRSAPVYATALPSTNRPSSKDFLLFFRPGIKYRGTWDDAAHETPGEPPAPVEVEQPPLNSFEWACYLVFGFMVVCTFSALAIVVWLTHTPFFAN